MKTRYPTYPPSYFGNIVRVPSISDHIDAILINFDPKMKDAELCFVFLEGPVQYHLGFMSAKFNYVGEGDPSTVSVESWLTHDNEHIREVGKRYVRGDYRLLKKAGRIINSQEFEAIKEFYGDRVAERSRVPLINHIVEGLVVLQMIGADEIAREAFCLHPLCQEDEDFVNFLGICDSISSGPAIAAAIEYRSVANEYLSHRKIQSIDEIRLSPSAIVNDMLIADKVQNRKDFEIYHQGTHPRSDELTDYFKKWHKRLGISDKKYQKFLKALNDE